jgi:multidrug efflux system membrane fusion protein
LLFLFFTRVKPGGRAMERQEKGNNAASVFFRLFRGEHVRSFMPLYPTTALMGATLVALAACSKGEGASAPRSTAVPVEVAPAVQIAAPVEITSNGVVEPMQTVAVEAQVGGMLTEVAFREGDAVSKGQLLFRIDPRPFETALRQAQAALARDEALAANARRDADRYRALVEKDYVTRAQADQVESNAASLRATLVADSAAVETARLNLAYTTITAPISGKTGSLLVREGNLVKSGGAPLVVINQLQPILVRFPVAQKDFGALRMKMSRGRLPVTAAAADGSVIGEAGGVSFVDNAVDSLTGTVTAKAEFGNGGNQLWPGEYVRLTVRLDVVPNTIAIPTRAIVAGQNGATVFVLDHGDKVALRAIQAGRQVGELTTVAQGVTVGEQVVVNGQSRLTNGTKVDVRSAITSTGAEK